jgi:pimeloyl-ACP methyl ester carboxylesterase
MHTEGRVELRDGRRLAYASLGRTAGSPVFYLHGAIGSPLRPAPALEAVIADLGVRYVMVSRPGFGASDAHPGRTMLGFADDLAQLADALALERFAVVGVSAGGPYALACAHALRARVTAAAVVSSLSCMCPPHAVAGLPARIRIPLRALAAAPGPAAILGDAVVALVRRHPGLLLRTMTAGASSADRTVLDDAETGDGAVQGFLAATVGGVRGLVADYELTCRPWGFAPEDVDHDVHLWHGVQDRLVPVEHALQLAVALPRCRTALDPDEGHFFYRRRLREILGALVTSRAARRPSRPPSTAAPVSSPPP